MKRLNWLNSLFLILLSGCCTATTQQKNDDQIIPLWSTYLNSKMIYNGGLIDTHIYDDCAIFHTTLSSPWSSSDATVEDNRLCGVNIETGEIEWWFGNDLTVQNDLNINSEGYIYDRFLVFKSLPLGNKRTEEVICLDLDKNEMLWSHDMAPKYQNTLGGVYGYEDCCYFAQRDNGISLIYSADVRTGELNMIYRCVPSDGYTKTRCSDKHFAYNKSNKVQLLFFVMEYNNDEQYDNYLYCLDVDTGTLAYKKEMPHIDGEYSFHDCDLVGNKLYGVLSSLVVCVDVDNGGIIWQYKNDESWGPYVLVSNGFVLKYGPADCIALNASTGKMIWSMPNGIHWAYVDGDYVYLCDRGDRIRILNINTGALLDTLVCPEEQTTGNGFDCATLPVIKDDRLYIMSNTSAYCYPAYPWKQNE